MTFSPADISDLLKYAKAAELAYGLAQGMTHEQLDNAWLHLGYGIMNIIMEPSTDTHVMIAQNEDEIERDLADDPWTRSGILTTTRIARWNLRIGEVA